jgi:hypothetical protein
MGYYDMVEFIHFFSCKASVKFAIGMVAGWIEVMKQNGLCNISSIRVVHGPDTNFAGPLCFGGQK